MINRVAPAFLVPVLLSIFCIFIGIFLAKTDDPDSKLFLYIVGNRRGVYFLLSRYLPFVPFVMI